VGGVDSRDDEDRAMSDERIAELERRLALANERIEKLDELLEEKNAEIGAADIANSDQAREIQELTGQVGALKEAIKDLYEGYC
jgi:chromosome segregation ATPase